MNLTPVPRNLYGIGVPESGTYEVILNTDDGEFGGSSYSSQKKYSSENIEAHGFKQQIRLNLPPLSVLYLKLSEG